MPFTFKQFHIDDTDCGMPVSTDGVLLGAWAPLTQTKNILDIGAGSGLLSLMAAQRSQAHIQAVEIDPSAAKACKRNFGASSWDNRLKLYQGDIKRFCLQCQTAVPAIQFDHIICNPPYFDNGPISDTSVRAMARHTHGLNFDELTACIKALLTNDGQVSLILPIDAMDSFSDSLQQQRLKVTQRVDVSTVPNKAPSRVLLTAKHMKSPATEPAKNRLCIRSESNQYTEAMVKLTKDFYLAL